MTPCMADPHSHSGCVKSAFPFNIYRLEEKGYMRASLYLYSGYFARRSQLVFHSYSEFPGAIRYFDIYITLKVYVGGRLILISALEFIYM